MPKFCRRGLSSTSLHSIDQFLSNSKHSSNLITKDDETVNTGAGSCTASTDDARYWGHGRPCTLPSPSPQQPHHHNHQYPNNNIYYNRNRNKNPCYRVYSSTPSPPPDLPTTSKQRPSTADHQGKTQEPPKKEGQEETRPAAYCVKIYETELGRSDSNAPT